MRKNGLHLGPEALAGKRGAAGDDMARRSPRIVLRTRREEARNCGSLPAQGRGKAAVGTALTVAGCFWIGYAAALVLIAWEAL